MSSPPSPSDGANTEPQTPKSKSSHPRLSITLPKPRAVHLTARGETVRRTAWGQAYALTETPPSVDALDVVRWLAVEQHARYRPVGGTTYCNVYAYDLCNAQGAYLPRVWWSPASVAAIQRGDDPEPILGATVHELSANALYSWLAASAADFGWVRTDSLDDAQDAANGGRAVVICGRNRVGNHSGHISVICPESEAVPAIRGESNAIRLPVQSQAGARNYELAVVGPGAWWLSPVFAEFGFWMHEPSRARDTLPAPPVSDNSLGPVRWATERPSEIVRAEDFARTLAEPDGEN